MGVRHLRLTGGEPLVRRNIVDLAQRLAAEPGIDDLSLSSNGVRLARLAEPLRRAGVRRINVSLDSLDPATYRSITGGKLEKVLQGLAAAKAAGFAPIKLNTVVMRGVNAGEIEAIFEFAVREGYALRLIETMPMGTAGQGAMDRYIDLETIRRRLTSRYELIPDILPGAGPARYYRVVGSDAHIGFITPLSQHFCQSCNRVRLSVTGELITCLGDEHRYPLRELLRAGCDDQTLSRHLRQAIESKPEGHDFLAQPARILRPMSTIGG
jgi:cyclic pyranopterin phosphate synthase